MSNQTEEKRVLTTRRAFREWLASRPKGQRIFAGADCSRCALAQYTGGQVVIGTCGGYTGFERELPQWAYQFNKWAMDKRRFTVAEALGVLK